MKLAKIVIALVASLCLGGTATGQNVFPSNGNVGIGTSTPQQKLHVHSNGLSFIKISGIAPGLVFSPASSSSLSVAAMGLSTSSNHYITGSSSGDLNIRSSIGKKILFGSLTNSVNNATIRMSIANDGKVNVGPGISIDPYALLNVEGSIFSDNAVKTRSVKLDKNQGRLKLRRHIAGDMVFKTALAPSSTVVTELLINPDNEFSSGTRVKGTKLVVDGVLGIGTSDTRGYKLAVRGNILAEELKIRTYANWPDYVFEAGYDLKPLSEVEQEIAETGHLSGVPSAAEVNKNGFNVSEMNAKLLEKVEELTLYTIQQQKELDGLKAKLNALLEDH